MESSDRVSGDNISCVAANTGAKLTQTWGRQSRGEPAVIRQLAAFQCVAFVVNAEQRTL